MTSQPSSLTSTHGILRGLEFQNIFEIDRSSRDRSDEYQGTELSSLRPMMDGWRVGRNPPSVPSSIYLIGEPAPQAELTGVYIPFHSAMGARFIPRPALHPGRPGEHPIIVTRYRDGYRFCAPTQALA